MCEVPVVGQRPRLSAPGLRVQVVGSTIAVTTEWQIRARRGGLMSSTVTDVKEYQWYAGGQWRDVANGQLLDDFEPDRGNLYARVADLRCRRRDRKSVV